MNSAPHLIDLTGFILPDSTNLLRRHVRKPARRSAHYLERYDRQTLFYDCVYQPQFGQYLFTAPRFLNLWPVLRAGLRLNGEPVRLRRKNRGKYEQVVLTAPEGALTLILGDETVPLETRASLAPLFASLNCIVTMNKDNDLKWIGDWARYNVVQHDLKGLLIFDNGSTAYAPQAVAECLASVEGLEQAVVASAPYPYGTGDSGTGWEIRPKFLQPALLNLARTDFLREARAVLNVDIDELVTRRGARTVFDAAAARPQTALKIPSQWAYPSPGTAMPAPHGAHICRAVPAKRSNNKWCAVPGGFLSRTGWFVHHVGGELFKFLRSDPDFEVVHCRCTSTAWKVKDRRYALPDELRNDAELAALMASHFPDNGEPR